jgi:DNA-binding NarL/FixJ family response regulator
MLNDKTIKNLKSAMTALNKPASSTGAWDALEPLSRIAEDGTRLTIDMHATDEIGAPIIVAQPPSNANNLFAPLTARQRQVAERVVAGHSNKQIARDLNISLGTVKDHVHAILNQLDYSSRTQLIAAALSR